MPASPEPFTQFQPYAWVRRNIADISRLHAVLRHKPELIADPTVANWNPARLPALTSDGFEERIPWRRHADSEEQLNRRVEHVFLQRVNNLMFHFSATNTTMLSQHSSHPKENHHPHPLKLTSRSPSSKLARRLGQSVQFSSILYSL